MDHLKTDPLASNLFNIGGANAQGALRSCCKPTADDTTRFVKAVKEELGPDIKTFEGLLQDYEQNRINATALMASVSILFAKRPDLREGFNRLLPYVESHRNPSHPVASGPSTATQTVQITSADDGASQQPKDTQQYNPPLDRLTTMQPTLQWLALSIQPPALTRPRVELFPPPVARLLTTNIDVRYVYAIATLHCKNTSERQEQYVCPCSNGIFCFSGIKTPKQGVYTFRVALVYGCHIMEYVDSNEIYSGPRPTEDVITVQDTRKLKRQLLSLDEIPYIDDYIGVFPNRKFYAGSMIYLGRQKYMKVIVLIPSSEFIVWDSNVDGCCSVRDGLSFHEDGKWYDDGENEWTDSLDATIHLGEDGEMYRQRMDGIFQSFLVALERKVTVVDAVTYIAHTVLYLE